MSSCKANKILLTSKARLSQDESSGTERSALIRSLEKDEISNRKRQSPVNIGEHVKAHYADLVWSKEYNQIPTLIETENNGSTVEVKVTFAKNDFATLSGGPLLHHYTLDSFHFHWGSGSEHGLFGQHFPMEIHFVHKRDDLTDEEMHNFYDGVAVVGIFVEIGGNDNPVFTSITDSFDKIRQEKTTAQLSKPFAISEIFTQFKNKYFTYGGSLTTVPYSECVMWILSDEKVRISKNQYNKFVELAGGNPKMNKNTRAMQELNGRTVYFSTRHIKD